MSSLGGLGIALSVVFVGFVLLLVAELYYLLCWKKRKLQQRGRINSMQEALVAGGGGGGARQQRGDEECELVTVLAASRYTSSNVSGAGELLVATKLLPLGPPRFLFTINEETSEELEAAAAARSRGGSRDMAHETPFVTPPSSPGDLYMSPLPREPKAARLVHQHHQRHYQQRTTMMMLLRSTPPGTPPATPPHNVGRFTPSPLLYRTPPTHLIHSSLFSPSPPLDYRLQRRDS